MSECETVRVERVEPSAVDGVPIVMEIECHFPAGTDFELVVRELFHAYAEAMLKLQEIAFADWAQLEPDDDLPAAPLSEPESSS